MEWTIEKKTSLIEWQCIEADSIEDLKEKLKTELPNMQWEHEKVDFCIDNFRAYNEDGEEYELDKVYKMTYDTFRYKKV